jgi:chemotaxis protein methyltransferase CheR
MPISDQTPAHTASPSITPREFDDIRQLAYRTFGLDLKHGKEEMVSARLQRLVTAGGFRSFHDYHRHVVQDSTGRSLAALVDALATNHTSFLRERDHFDFFRDRVVPELSRRPSTRIWCAASATGEEVWTLACVLNDALPAANIRIHATDISNKALRVAQAGEYAVERCEAIPAAWLSRYFEKKPANSTVYKVAPRVRAQAEFQRLNLVEPFHWPQQFPAVFCRNVMIYFDRVTQEKVVAGIANCLEPGGYLFVGHAESMTGISHSLEYVRPAVYRKPGGKAGR